MAETSLREKRIPPTYMDDNDYAFFGTHRDMAGGYNTRDANAACGMIDLPAGGAVDVPVLAVGIDIIGRDLGLFNGVTETTVAVINSARDAYVSLDAGDVNATNARGLYFYAAADEDINILKLSVTGTPTLIWDESADSFHWNKPLTIETAACALIVQNTTDAASNEVLRLGGGNRATPADNDEVYITFYLDDSTGTQVEYGRITLVATDVTSTTQDARFQFDIMKGDTLTEIFRMDSTTAGAVTGMLTAPLILAESTNPAGTYCYIGRDNTGDLTLNALVNKAINLAIAGTDEVTLTASALSPATSDGSALGTTALMWADLFLASDAVINFNNGNQTITHSNATTTLTLTGKLAFGGNTDWGAGATGTEITGAGYDWVTQTIGRVNTDINNTAAAAAYHALSVTVSQANSNSFFGTWTELYVSNSVNLTGADNLAAVWGQFEAGTNVTLSDTGCFTAGVYANVKAGATLTVAAGHSLNGVRAQLEVAAVTMNGKSAAFECLKKSGTVDWDYGLYIANVTTDIRLDDGATILGDNSGDMTLNALSSKQVHIAIAGTDEYDFSATALAMNANTITGCGTITMDNAAGPTVVNEAATTTNPTLCPNRAEDDTGLGWASDTIHIVLGGASEYSFSTSTLDMNANTITDCGTITTTNAAGPSIANEAATTTNPTLIPNQAEMDTGIGWASDTIHIVLGGASEYSFSTTALAMNGNNITGLGSIGLTGAITISPTAAGTFLDFELETEWVSGTLIRADFGGATTLSDDAIGLLLDFNGNITMTTDKDVTVIQIKLPALTQTAANTTTIIGYDLPTAGALEQNTNAGTINWYGLNIQMPNMTQTTGTVLASAIRVSTGTYTSGTERIIDVVADNDADVTLLYLSVTGTPTLSWDESDDRLTLNIGLDIDGTMGYDITPGSDTDTDLITCNVTGTPIFGWDESEDAFSMSKGLHMLTERVQAFRAEYNITTQQGAWVHGVKVELTRAADIQPSTGCWFGGQFVLNIGTGYTDLDKPAYALQAIIKGDAASPDGIDVHVARFETQASGKVSDICYITANTGTTIVGSLLYIPTHVAPGVAMVELNAQSSVTVPIGVKFESGAGSSYNYLIDANGVTVNTADIRLSSGDAIANTTAGAITFSTSITSDTDNTDYLGSTTVGWKGVHIATNILLIEESAGLLKFVNSANTTYTSIKLLDITPVGNITYIDDTSFVTRANVVGYVMFKGYGTGSAVEHARLAPNSFQLTNGELTGTLDCDGETIKDVLVLIVGNAEASAVACTSGTIRAPYMTGGTTSNVGGADLTISTGKGTGTGDPAQFIIQLAYQAASGTTLQSVGNALVMDGDITTSGITTHTFSVPTNTTLPDATPAWHRMVGLSAYTITLLGQTQVTTAMDGIMLHIGQPTINQSGGAVTVDEASVVYISTLAAGTDVTITNARMIDTGVTDCYLTNAGVWTDTASTIKIKQDVQPLDMALMPNLIDQLQPVSFKYRKTNLLDDSGRQRYGVIAEELPEFLRVPGGYTEGGLSAAVLSTFELAAIKYLNEENKSLKARVAELEALMLKN